MKTQTNNKTAKREKKSSGRLPDLKPTKNPVGGMPPGPPIRGTAAAGKSPDFVM